MLRIERCLIDATCASGTCRGAGGRALDFFVVGRNLKGTVYMLPLAILMVGVLTFSSAGRFSKLKLPRVDAPKFYR